MIVELVFELKFSVIDGEERGSDDRWCCTAFSIALPLAFLLTKLTLSVPMVRRPDVQRKARDSRLEGWGRRTGFDLVYSLVAS
jgi:hypothetical protein